MITTICPAPVQQSPGVDPELAAIMDALVPTTIAALIDGFGTVLGQNPV
jgi:hypothetical protein